MNKKKSQSGAWKVSMEAERPSKCIHSKGEEFLESKHDHRENRKDRSVSSKEFPVKC